MPMLASTRTVTPSTVNGGASARGRAAATVSAPLGVDVVQEDGELVAAEAGEQVVARGRRQPGEPLGHVAEQVVAGVVAQAVVDLLEPVEVEQQQRAGCVVGQRARSAARPARRTRGGCPGR